MLILLKNSSLLLEQKNNFEIVIEAENGVDFVTQLSKSSYLPDVCIIDMAMFPLSGYETTLVVNKKWPAIKLIVLSMYNHELVITKVLAAGAACFLDKNRAAPVFFQAIENVHNQGYYHTETVTKILLKNLNKNTALQITAKELHFLHLCKSDLSYKEIASIMGVESRTVDNYRNSLFEKLNTHTRNGLISFVALNGIEYLSIDYLLKNKLLD